MVGWIALSLVLLALGLLWVSLASVVGRLRPLARALRRLALHRERAQLVQAAAEVLHHRVAELTVKVEQVSQGAGRLRRDQEMRRRRPRP